MKQTKKRTYPRRTSAVQFTVWSANNGPIPPQVVEQLESALETEILKLFNSGHRLLTQTSRS